MIRWKLLEYFLVYKLCNSLDILIGLQWNMLYSKSNQRATGFLRQIFYCRQRLTEAVRQKSRYFFFFFKKKSSIYYTGRNGRLWQVQSTYLNTEEKRSNKKGEGKGKWKGKMLHFYLEESRCDNISTIVKAECARVVHKEVDKAVYDDIAWTCGWVICIALHDDMFSCLDFSFATWTADGEVREESLSILPNGSVAGCHASETGAKQVGEAYRRKP